MKVNRRDFLSKAFQGAAIIALPGILGSVLESCNSANPTNPANASSLSTIQATSQSGLITIDINSSSPLAKTGSAALLQFQNGSILVDHPSDTTFNALSSICTHQGCTITNYDAGSQNFVCPCHGSVFNAKGQVVSGPAGSSLPTYQNQYVNGQLTIKVG